jgi:hypothetical protein
MSKRLVSIGIAVLLVGYVNSTGFASSHSHKADSPGTYEVLHSHGSNPVAGGSVMRSLLTSSTGKSLVTLVEIPPDTSVRLLLITIVVGRSGCMYRLRA